MDSDIFDDDDPGHHAIGPHLSGTVHDDIDDHDIDDHDIDPGYRIPLHLDSHLHAPVETDWEPTHRGWEPVHDDFSDHHGLDEDPDHAEPLEDPALHHSPIHEPAYDTSGSYDPTPFMSGDSASLYTSISGDLHDLDSLIDTTIAGVHHDVPSITFEGTSYPVASGPLETAAWVNGRFDSLGSLDPDHVLAGLPADGGPAIGGAWAPPIPFNPVGDSIDVDKIFDIDAGAYYGNPYAGDHIVVADPPIF